MSDIPPPLLVIPVVEDDGPDAYPCSWEGFLDWLEDHHRPLLEVALVEVRPRELDEVRAATKTSSTH